VAEQAAVDAEVEHFMAGLIKRNPAEPEFHQAVLEMARSVMPYVLDHPDWRTAEILERMTEPDRIVIFRVSWEDDEGRIRANRAWRVQFNNSIGPYKGGLRFHPSVNQSILKFLGFEQTYKNALTGLPMGGAKGGANFNPKGKSDLPCATQNELDEADAKVLVANGCRLVAEGANMPSTIEAQEYFRESGILYGPSKAANAGGVGVSGLEQSQNALRIPWTRDEVDTRLRQIMRGIDEQCAEWGTRPDGSIDYVDGANLAAFHKVGSAMHAYGIV